MNQKYKTEVGKIPTQKGRNNKSSQVKKFFIPSKENVGATHKEQRQCTYVKD